MINRSVSVEVKVIPIVAVSPLYVVATEGDPVTLKCNAGDEENLEIMWHNSTQSGSFGRTRELYLSNIKLPVGHLRYAVEYWCVATNSGVIGRSQNVTVHILSKDFNKFCAEENSSGNYTWEKTPVDVSVIKYCPQGKI
ncbi:inactive tyrosine- kinase 7-like, partial [Paramuricea clavata]